MTGSSSLQIDDSTPGVRVLALNRPHRLNALDGDTLTALLGAIHECNEPGKDVRVLVIRGNGRAFCSGSDLKWLADGVLQDTAAHLQHQDRMQHAFEALENARQVVIASVQGMQLPVASN